MSQPYFLSNVELFEKTRSSLLQIPWLSTEGWNVRSSEEFILAHLIGMLIMWGSISMRNCRPSLLCPRKIGFRLLKWKLLTIYWSRLVRWDDLAGSCRCCVISWQSNPILAIFLSDFLAVSTFRSSRQWTREGLSETEVSRIELLGVYLLVWGVGWLEWWLGVNLGTFELLSCFSPVRKRSAIETRFCMKSSHRFEGPWEDRYRA